MSFTSCCFKEGEKNLHKAVLWHCTTAVCAHRRVKSSGFAALGMMGRKTLLDTGLDHWRSHWHCLPCSPPLLFFFLSLKLLIRDCCNWLRLWELILVHKFWHWKPAKRLCGGGEWLHRIWCGVCLFSFLQPNTSTNPWADLDLFVHSQLSPGRKFSLLWKQKSNLQGCDELWGWTDFTASDEVTIALVLRQTTNVTKLAFELCVMEQRAECDDAKIAVVVLKVFWDNFYMDWKLLLKREAHLIDYFWYWNGLTCKISYQKSVELVLSFSHMFLVSPLAWFSSCHSSCDLAYMLVSKQATLSSCHYSDICPGCPSTVIHRLKFWQSQGREWWKVEDQASWNISSFFCGVLGLFSSAWCHMGFKDMVCPWKSVFKDGTV